MLIPKSSCSVTAYHSLIIFIDFFFLIPCIHFDYKRLQFEEKLSVACVIAKSQLSVKSKLNYVTVVKMEFSSKYSFYPENQIGFLSPLIIFHICINVIILSMELIICETYCHVYSRPHSPDPPPQ